MWERTSSTKLQGSNFTDNMLHSYPTPSKTLYTANMKAGVFLHVVILLAEPSAAGMKRETRRMT